MERLCGVSLFQFFPKSVQHAASSWIESIEIKYFDIEYTYHSGISYTFQSRES